MKCDIRRVVYLLLACIVVGLPGHARAQAWVCQDQGWLKPGLSKWLHDFYAGQAQPILGAERRLDNGVAWRLVIDGATRLAAPRITRMPDKQAMQRANRLFEREQACRMITYYGMASQAFRLSQEQSEKDGDVSLLIRRDRFIGQPPDLTELTYATTSLLSGYRVLIDTISVRPDPYLDAFIWDLRTEKIVTVEPCRRDGNYFTVATPFRIEGILDLCDSEAHEKFVRLWQATIKAMARTPQYKPGPTSYCSEDEFDLAPPARREVVYALAGKGLAVRTSFLDTPANLCMLEKSPFNPVIIPYAELKPFMIPGPWRDELLALPGAKP